MKSFIVSAKLKSPSCYHSGYEFSIVAKNKAEAIKRARVEASYAGHTRMDGALHYSAEVEA